VAVARQQPILIERRVGRFSADEREERRAIGRLAHRIEDCTFSVGVELVHTIGQLTAHPTHDAETDETWRQGEQIGRWLATHADPQVKQAGHMLIELAARYWRADALEDMTAKLAEAHARQARSWNQETGVVVEAAVTSRRRRRAPADQLGLLED
jgi:hypothetical protein